jgi:hypothetical protein
MEPRRVRPNQPFRLLKADAEPVPRLLNGFNETQASLPHLGDCIESILVVFAHSSIMIPKVGGCGAGVRHSKSPGTGHPFARLTATMINDYARAVIVCVLQLI